MKNILLLILILISIFTKAEKEKNIKSTIKNVTVFTQGAQVFRTADVSLSAGATDLILSDIPNEIDVSSIQAGGKGNFILLNIKQRIKYLEPPKKEGNLLSISQDINQLNDSIKELSFKLDDLNESLDAINFEKQMILKNKLAVGEGKSDSLPVLRQAMDFFKQRLEEINRRISNTNREIQKNTILQTQIQLRLADLNKYKSSLTEEVKYLPTNQIVISVSCDEPTSGTINLNYYIKSAGWVPSYDLRATDISSPVQITYKANIFQNSREDWNNVKLKLCTANPSALNIIPELPPWYIDFVKHENLGIRGARDGETIYLVDGMQVRGTPGISNDGITVASTYTNTIENFQNVSFDINLEFTIPSDKENHVVPIKSASLNSSFFYFLVPKIENTAFVIAQLTGWESLNLLPGKANVFYENTFMGSTFLNSNEINDTLNLAFGRENNLLVTRTKKTNKTSDNLLNNNVTETVTYELKLKNNKNNTLKLVVQDQIPVAKNDDIKVQLKNHGKAEYVSDSGLLKWKLEMNPKSSQTLSFGYSVSYDKSREVSLN